MRRGTKVHKWSAEERALITAHYADHTNKQLADMINAMAAHPVSVTPSGVQWQLKEMGLARPPSFWRTPEMAKSHLKKGHKIGRKRRVPGVPYRAKKDRDGWCWFVKLPSTGKCVPAHRYVWEQRNGPIPPGMLVRFTGPKTDLSRLELVSRRSLQCLNAKVMKSKQPAARKKAWAWRRKKQAFRIYTEHTPYQFAR